MLRFHYAHTVRINIALHDVTLRPGFPVTIYLSIEQDAMNILHCKIYRTEICSIVISAVWMNFHSLSQKHTFHIGHWSLHPTVCEQTYSSVMDNACVTSDLTWSIRRVWSDTVHPYLCNHLNERLKEKQKEPTHFPIDLALWQKVISCCR